ncbi:MAG: alpha/beta hydrolase [Planctomycetaceae bacterium]|jgi:pimeloyl-ACP methyl ester carboxylesterase
MLETWPVVRGMVYHPVRRRTLGPESWGLDPQRIRPVQVTTADGLTLRGWHCVGAPRVEFAPVERQRFPAGLIYFPGRGGHRGYRLLEISQLIDAGAEVLLVDYRGYGDNSGQPSEPGLARDARAIWNFSQTLPGWSPAHTVLYGESLGGALAVQLAADLSDRQTPPGGLILRSAFTSMTEAARSYRRWLRWFIPEGWYPSLERIPRVTCPLLSLHGTADEVVPCEMGQRLFAAAPTRSHNKIVREWIPFPDAGHNGLAVSHAPLLRAAVARFLERVTAAASLPSAGSNSD